MCPGVKETGRGYSVRGQKSIGPNGVFNLVLAGYWYIFRSFSWQNIDGILHYYPLSTNEPKPRLVLSHPANSWFVCLAWSVRRKNPLLVTISFWLVNNSHTSTSSICLWLEMFPCMQQIMWYDKTHQQLVSTIFLPNYFPIYTFLVILYNPTFWMDNTPFQLLYCVVES